MESDRILDWLAVTFWMLLFPVSISFALVYPGSQQPCMADSVVSPVFKKERLSFRVVKYLDPGHPIFMAPARSRNGVLGIHH